MRLFLLLSLTLLLTGVVSPSTSHAQVWTDTNEWSPAWENEYARWVEANWSIDFFARKTLPNGQPNIYYGLHVDCADTVYSMRIIFSAEHGLPFAMQDPTTYDQVITNRMTRWNRLAPSARVYQFLRYTYDMVSTHSMPNDTFPVPVSRDWIHAGGLIRTTEVNHHSWSIKRMLPIGVPFLVFNSTVNSSSTLTLQQRQSWPNPDWVFEGNFSPSSNAGFRYWRPLSALLLPVWKVPNYSEEQFRIPLSQWEKTVQQKLALQNEPDGDKMTRLYQTACEAAQNRIESVNDGVKALRALSTECMDAEAYDTLSTPSRDHRLFDDIAALRRAYKSIIRTSGGANVPTALSAELAHVFPAIRSSAKAELQQFSGSSSRTSSCLINYAPGKSIDLAEVRRRMFAGLMSNNPMDDMAYRWGEYAGPSPRAQACPNWGVWTPDIRQAD
jgi:hypothetical protein